METWFWILSWLLSILTMAGNGFVIFIVCRKRRLRTKTNAFIVSLAVADFCVGLSIVPPEFFCEMSTGCNPLGLQYNLIISSIWCLFLYSSAANLCSLVLDRYIAVAKSLTYLTFMKRRRVVQMISISWAIAFTFTVLVISLRFSSKAPLVINMVGWFYVVFELCLCFIVIFCFTSMLVVVCKHDRSARRLARQLRFNHQTFFKTHDKSALKMMAIVVCLFLLCYGLMLGCSFDDIINDRKIGTVDLQYKMLIYVLNSAINPLAYAFFKRDIKKEIRRLIAILLS